MKKTLITGATGGLGYAVASFLKGKVGSESLAVLVRDGEGEKAQQYRSEGFEVRVADYSEKTALIDAFKDIDVLYFVSGNDIHARFDQHKNVVDAAQAAQVGHILYTSTVRKDESPEAPLHLVVSTHASTEQWIKESGIAYTLLRHNLYGEVIPLFLGGKAQLLQSKTIFLPTGDGKVAFAPRADFAEAGANILAAPKAHENKIYEFNGSELFSFAQIAEILSQITKETIGYVSPEVAVFEETLAGFGLPANVVSISTSFSLGMANGEFDQHADDLETVLGRKTTSIATFLKEIYQ